jgi:hypothetical protein
MSIAVLVAAIQDSGQEMSSSPPGAAIFALGLFAVVVGFVVLILIRTSARRAPHQ